MASNGKLSKLDSSNCNLNKRALRSVGSLVVWIPAASSPSVIAAIAAWTGSTVSDNACKSTRTDVSNKPCSWRSGIEVILNAVLANMAHGGRIALCGATAQYAGESTGASFGPILARALTVRGIVMYEHSARFPAISDVLFAGLRSGQLRAYEDLAFGLESVPSAMLRLLQGQNVGKQLVVLNGAAQLEPKLTAMSN